MSSSGALPDGPARTDITAMPLTTTAAMGAHRPGALGVDALRVSDSERGRSSPDGGSGGGVGGGGISTCAGCALSMISRRCSSARRVSWSSDESQLGVPQVGQVSASTPVSQTKQ